MNNDMRNYIDLKFDVFDQHFEVPEDVAEEISAFRKRVEIMAEECATAVEFEEKFASTGLQEEYNSFFVRCKPRSVKMTADQRKESRKIFNEIAFGSNDKKVVAGKIAAGIAGDVVSHAKTDLESEAIRMRRERMIEDGTFDDYTRTRNKINDATRAAGFLKGLFGKK